MTKIKYKIGYGRRCRICNQALISTCDRTKPSELAEFATGRADQPIVKRKFYPTAQEQDDLCFRCKNKGSLPIGKDSSLTKMIDDRKGD